MKSYKTLLMVHTCFHVFPHVICGGQRMTFRIQYSPLNIWAPGLNSGIILGHKYPTCYFLRLYSFIFFLCLWNLWQALCFSLTCTGIVGVNHDLSPNLSIKKAGESCLKPHKGPGTRMSLPEPTESLEVVLTSESETINACCFKPTNLRDTVI